MVLEPHVEIVTHSMLPMLERMQEGDKLKPRCHTKREAWETAVLAIPGALEFHSQVPQGTARAALFPSAAIQARRTLDTDSPAREGKRERAC